MDRGLRIGGVCLAAMAWLWSSVAAAQDDPAGQAAAASRGEAKAQGPQPAGSNADQPTDKPQLRAFCTDRPTKTNGACILDQGHFQIESDLFNDTYDRADGVTTETYLFTSPTLKYGLTHDTDLEVAWTPYEAVRTYGRGLGGARTAYGVGDLYLRAKIGLVGQDGGMVAATLLPYVKVPTAPASIGDGAVEEALIVPIVVTFTDKFNITFDPEFDAYKNAEGTGRHFATQQLICAAYSLPRNVTVYGEFWAELDRDPAVTTEQYSADLAVTWGLPHDLQLDSGLNIGLNRDTPAVQGYVGVSRRF